LSKSAPLRCGLYAVPLIVLKLSHPYREALTCWHRWYLWSSINPSSWFWFKSTYRRH